MIDARLKLLLDLVNAPAVKWVFPDRGPAEKVVGEVHITYEMKSGFNILALDRHCVSLIPQDFGDAAEYQWAKKTLERQAGEARAMPSILALRQLAFGDTA